MHRPGAVPLRPLGLGDMYDASFKIIRFNATATIGSTLLVSCVALFIPALGLAALASMFDLSTDAFGEPMTESEVLVEIGSAAAVGIGSMFQALGLLLVTGMVAVVAQAAAVGKRLSIGEAWALTHGRRWRLIGLAMMTYLAYGVLTGLYILLWVLVVVSEPGFGLIVLWALASIPAFLALCMWLWARLVVLTVPAMMIERIGVFAALGRAFRLTHRQFWRTLGIAILTALVTSIAAGLLSVPFSLLSYAAPLFVDGNTGAYVALGATVLGSVISSAFVGPFSASVSSLQYIDQRMRKEGYDVELLSEAGITPS